MKKREYWLTVVGLITLILFLTSCSRKTQVVGILVTDGGEPLQNAAVELLLVTTESGKFEGTANIEIAHKAQTDDSGAFTFMDVQPGNYVLSCWVVPSGFPETGFLCITPYSNSPAVIGEDDFIEDCSAMFVIEVEKGQVIDLGEVLVNF